MIPRIIHQTWRDENIPDKYRELVDSWKSQHPGWTYRLWTDKDLDRLIAENCPDFLDQFRAYGNPVQRADAGRYMILYMHGGVYADLDTLCHKPFDLLCNEERIVLAHEPAEHFDAHCKVRNLDHVLFNGIIASPKGHPFWVMMLEEMKRCRYARNVLDTTGPLVLTACAQRYDAPGSLCINSCHIFNPLAKDGTQSRSERFGEYCDHHLSTHYWFGSWFSPWSETPFRKIKKNARRIRHRLTRGPFMSQSQAVSLVDRAVLETPLDTSRPIPDQKICCLIPVRDAEPHLDRCIKLLRELDHPRANLKIAFCEGDSQDGTWSKLQSIEEKLRGEFAGIRCLRKNTGNRFDRADRWKPRLQKQRRSGLAQVRNYLIDEALDDDADWALWIDADVNHYPPDILTRLLREQEKIVVPNCVLEPGGLTYDLNSFVVTDDNRDSAYYKHVHGGLYTPPVDTSKRLYFHDLRYCDRIKMNGVGGTMLLVHASVHRARIRFPEIPYQNLLETEGFGYWAHDCGIVPIGLPNTEIRHVRS
ncbi:glycosyltransferase [Hoeflea sp. TYP-13]|uniref:glycosyltransferase n=1 Tax=Hoeflea sp. TYP-13 TaxID=3230023 RepID=UPI0034C606E6